MALGHFLFPAVLVGGLSAGGAATFLFKKEHEGDANTLTIYKRTGGSHLSLGGPETQELPLSSTSIFSIDKEGWQHNIDNQNGSSFKLTTGHYIRHLEGKGSWGKVLKDDSRDEDVVSGSNGITRPSTRKSNDKFNGELVVYVGGATCGDIIKKSSELKYKLKEQTKVFGQNKDIVTDSKTSSLLMWDCMDTAEQKKYETFMKEFRETFPEFNGDLEKFSKSPSA
ncbi:hypothetical protein [Mycoplasma suis]|uniref:Uncharacterized protein n=2 Tax=Mycoplasma suis TaxID=57372 RepID=F0QQU2_MYCSL|nr:hypothetical protein [Mycoplasma suis]ADX97862.1 hypothetical protein MSU_0320 [Mycoplasma suis str. Illinois]CBZ40362.1 hypothetical protein MSUIS_02690 [Mycoplasma suis KI3806]